jgi:hypothetical protein
LPAAKPLLLYEAYFSCSSSAFWETNDVSHSSHLKDALVVVDDDDV